MGRSSRTLKLKASLRNRTLLDMARTMLDEYKTPDRFWAEAINIACYSINRLYLHRILKKTSYELLTGKKPNVSYLESLVANVLFLLKEVENLNLLLRL
jgi:reverse gyrase